MQPRNLMLHGHPEKVSLTINWFIHSWSRDRLLDTEIAEVSGRCRMVGTVLLARRKRGAGRWTRSREYEDIAFSLWWNDKSFISYLSRDCT
jgi:hypothetical protein